MGTGQLISLMAAFVLLSRLLLSVNQTIITKNELVQESEATIYATTLAQAMIQEVSLKSFDQKTVTTSIFVADSLTPRTSLGVDVGEVFPKYNDLDDYGNYKRTTKNPRLGNFQTKVSVIYATTTGDSSGKPTFYKKISVTVSDSSKLSLKVPVQITNIISY